MIYLDNAATTPLDPEVYSAMLPYLSWGQDNFGNPGSLHCLGRKAREAVENARVQVAEFIGSEPEQIIFTSGGSEGNSLVFFGLADYLEKQNKKSLFVSAIEHDSVLKAARALNIKRGFHVHEVQPILGSGCVAPEDFWPVDGARDGLVSVMYSNNETGAVNPVREITSICRENGVLFHTDCVQAAGFYPINVQKIGCDFLTLSAHKIHGPKGVGAVFAKDPSLLTPMIYGGSNQEFGIRGGTENVAGIVGFGKACEIAGLNLEKDHLHIEQAAMAFLFSLSQRIGYCCRKNGVSDIVGNKTVSICFDGVDAETLLLMLDSYGIYASAGSACNSKEVVPSHVLLAMGLSEEEAKSTVRFSFSKMTSLSDAADAAQTVANCVETLREYKHGGA